jgi:CDP-glycerol glycerophosphotransferase
MARSTIITRIWKAARTAVLDVGKRAPWLLTLARAAVTTTRRVECFFLRMRYGVDPSVAVFESFSGRGYSCSPRALYRAMLLDPRFDGVEKIWAFQTEIVEALAKRGGYDTRGLEGAEVRPPLKESLEVFFGADALDELRHAVIVPWGSPEYRRCYMRAALWVSNSRIPAYLWPRKGQSYVQAWHGTPLKRLGCDIPVDVANNAIYSARGLHGVYAYEGKRFTWLLSPSRFTSEKLASAFDLAAIGRTDTIVEEGYPRNDYLSTFTPQDVAGIRERLGVPENKKVILYAPTWRDDLHVSGVGYTLDLEADFGMLRESLGDDYVILFRAHPFISNAFDFASWDGFVSDVSKTDDINDLYVISDVLVTDYSSVFFDFANLRRPVVFFMYDLDHYAGGIRGFYLGLDELPGPVVRTTSELVDAIRASESPTDNDRLHYERFCERFTYLDDGHASERVLSRILAEGALRTAGAAAEGGRAS